MRGRKPKPAAQKRREGNAGKRPIVEGMVASGLPLKPEFLSRHAEEEWDRVVPELTRLGVAKSLHTGPLIAMCVQWGIAEDARETFESEGLVEQGSMGQMVEHPMVATYTKAVTAYMRIATEFGMTASAAMRVAGAREPGGPQQPFADIGTSPRLKALRGGRA
jgi:P27 family predicted phage terminase small subunit